MNDNADLIKSQIDSMYKDMQNSVLVSVREKLQDEHNITSCDGFGSPSKNENPYQINLSYHSLCLEHKKDKEHFRGVIIKIEFQNDGEKVTFSVWSHDYLNNEILLLPQKEMDCSHLLQCLNDITSFKECL